MNRGIYVVIVCALAAAVGACKGKPDSKQRVPGGERASTARLIKSLEAAKDLDGSLLALIAGVTDECGKGCACLGAAGSIEAGEVRDALLTCPSLCTADARAKAKAAGPGQEVEALALACTPAGIGLTADTVTKVGNDWLAAFVAGQYLADQLELAGADRAAVEAAMKALTIPLAPTVELAGVTIATAERAGSAGAGRVYVSIDAKGRFQAGRTLSARFTATGAELVPQLGRALTDGKDLQQYVNALLAGPVAGEPGADQAADLKPTAPDDLLPDNPPPPLPEDEDGDDESGGTGTAMALDEGKMRKKDSDRAGGQYKMQNTGDPQLARAQAIEAARTAGILGAAELEQGGAFASITGTRDFSSGLDDRDIDTGLLAGPAHSVIGLASTPVRDPIVVFADRQAPAQKVVEALGVATAASASGAMLAVEHKGRLAAVPVVFGDSTGWAGIADRARAEEQLDPVIDVGAARVLVGSRLGEWTEIKITGDVVDLAAVEKAVGDLLEQAVFADRRDVVVSVRDDARTAQMMPAIDAALGAGARAIRLETWFDRSAAAGGWGLQGIGHGSGTGTSTGFSVGTGRGRSSSVPIVSIGSPSATGDLDKAIIRRYIKRNLAKITYCYEKELLAKPTLSGTVRVQFFIAPSGSVATSDASGVDPSVAACVAAVIKSIEFPKPKGGGGVQVNYPFVFRASGGG